MALNTKDVETDRLARELARLTGESLTVALRRAIEDRLVAQRRTRVQPAEDVTRLSSAGGRWDYGYNLFALTMSSDYYHESQCHGTTVIQNGDRTNRSIDTIAGQVAHSGLGWVAPTDGKEYYYRVC